MTTRPFGTNAWLVLCSYHQVVALSDTVGCFKLFLAQLGVVLVMRDVVQWLDQPRHRQVGPASVTVNKHNNTLRSLRCSILIVCGICGGTLVQQDAEEVLRTSFIALEAEAMDVLRHAFPKANVAQARELATRDPFCSLPCCSPCLHAAFVTACMSNTSLH